MQPMSTVGSVPLGRYNGLPLRLHISFLLVAIFVFFFRLQAGGDPFGNTGLILLVWLAAVLIHEAGHCFMVHRIGGDNEMLVFTPFGGLSFHSFPQQAGKDLWVALSGPLISFFAFVLSIGGLFLLDDSPIEGLWGWGNGLPDFFAAAAPIVGLRLAVWINLGLVLLNLLPTMPFDGGWSLHAFLWPTMGDQRAWHVVRKASHATSLGIFVLAIVTGVNHQAIGNMPLWLPLIILAVYCFCFSVVPLSIHSINHSDHEIAREGQFAADSSVRLQNTEFEADEPQQDNPFVDEHTPFFPTKDKAENQKADSALDDVLQCVHDRGLASLTQAQRQVLQEAAKRYRSRSPK